MRLKMSLALSLLIGSSAFSQTITLKSGWNFVAVNEKPLSIKDLDVKSIVSKNPDIVMIYRNGKKYPSNLSFQRISTLEPGKGYWVKIADNKTVTISYKGIGKYVAPSFSPGWNAVGFDHIMKSENFISSMFDKGIKIDLIYRNGKYKQ
jgi:hypothetical protein